jgi:hypothetical protein
LLRHASAWAASDERWNRRARAAGTADKATTTISRRIVNRTRGIRMAVHPNRLGWQVYSLIDPLQFRLGLWPSPSYQKPASMPCIDPLHFFGANRTCSTATENQTTILVEWCSLAASHISGKANSPNESRRVRQGYINRRTYRAHTHSKITPPQTNHLSLEPSCRTWDHSHGSVVRIPSLGSKQEYAKGFGDVDERALGQ